MSRSSHSKSSTSSIIHGYPEEDLRQDGKDNPGYFPARLGQPLEGGRFVIVRKLGWGEYSSVWLAKDKKQDQFVALKILTCESTKALQASDVDKRSDELAMLQKIATAQSTHRGFKHNLHLHDSFKFQGPHGQHLCLVTDVLGYSVDYVRRSRDDGKRSLSMALTKRITKQILYALEYLHDVCGIIHTDIKHDNILLRLSDVDAVVTRELAARPSILYHGGTEIVLPTVPVRSQPLPLSLEQQIVSPTHAEAVLADVGHSHWKDHHFQETIQPDALRAPEVILGYPWGPSADIWNLGCLVTEHLIGFWLFEFSAYRDEWSAEDDHLARMTEALGTKFDPSFLSKCKNSQKFFNLDGSWKNFSSHKEPTWPLEELLARFSSADLGEDSVKAAGKFLRRCLQLIPEERATAQELLEDPWLVDV